MVEVLCDRMLWNNFAGTDVRSGLHAKINTSQSIFYVTRPLVDKIAPAR